MKKRKKKLARQLKEMEKSTLKHEVQHAARRERWLQHEYIEEPAYAERIVKQ